MPQNSFNLITLQDITDLHNELTTIIHTQIPIINPEEKITISNAIKQIQFTDLNASLLYFIKKEIAELLAQSTHPILKDWGNKFISFYLNEGKKVYVAQDTGLVSTPSFNYGSFKNLKGVWDVRQNKWVVLHNYVNKYVEATLYGLPRRFGHAEVNPCHFSLLTPAHVAALIGDIPLMELLISKGFDINNKLNVWNITPLELAVRTDQTNVVQWLLTKKITQNLDKGLKTAVETGSLETIDTLLNGFALITDEVLTAANNRHADLHNYLDKKRKFVFAQTVEHDPFKALQKILNYSNDNKQLVIDFICAYPDVINAEDVNGDTPLHSTIKTKSVEKIETLVNAIFTASFEIKNLNWDVEKKNKQNKSLLQLAMETSQNDIIHAILLYANPKKTQPQETALHNAGIKFSEIEQEKNGKLILDITRKQAQNLRETNEATINNTQDLDNLEHNQVNMQQIMQTMQQRLDDQGQIVYMQQNMIFQLCNYIAGMQIQLEQNGIHFDPQGLPPLPVMPVTPQYIQASSNQANNRYRLLPPPRLETNGINSNNISNNNTTQPTLSNQNIS